MSPAYLVVPPQSDIDDVADLRGRRVATAATGGGSPVTVALNLKAYGMSVSDLQLTTFRGEDVGQRLFDGTFDALFVMGGFATETVRATSCRT